MLEYLDNSEILMYSTHNEGRQVSNCWKIYKNIKGENLLKKWMLMVANLLLDICIT